MVARGGRIWGRDREFGINMDTLLCLQWIIKDLLDSTESSAQCYTAAWVGGEMEKWIHI